MQTVVMPKMGDTMEEGKILAWLKQEGDPVQRGDALAEIETEKVNIEAEAFAEGVLRKVLAQEGATWPSARPSRWSARPTSRSRRVAGGRPNSGDGADGAHGRRAARRQPGRGRSGASPTEMPQPAPTATQPRPRPVACAARQRETLPASGEGCGDRRRTGARASDAEYGGAASPPAPSVNGGRVFISPIARHIAAGARSRHHAHPGTGPNGRIIKDDVEAALAQPQQAPAGAGAQP